MNVLCGVPRGGSTLVCNILNQNPKFHATSTSPLVGFISTFFTGASASIEIKGDLARDREGTENRIKRTVRGMCHQWHREHGDKIVFDKSRGWSLHTLELREIFPDSKVIVMIRDLRDVFASIEKHHLNTSIFHENPVPGARTLAKRFESSFDDKGVIGRALLGIQDTILRPGIEVFYLKFEELWADPKGVFNKLYCYLMEDEYEHDFDNVENVATDPDYMYFNKFPHEGSGKVQEPSGSWEDFLHPEMAKSIMQTNPWFHETFEYK